MGKSLVLYDEPGTRTADAEGRYRLLVDAITDYAVYMLDRNGVVTSWNPGAQRFKGYTAAPARVKSDMQVIYDELNKKK